MYLKEHFYELESDKDWLQQREQMTLNPMMVPLALSRWLYSIGICSNGENF
jgi:hypothetical protein